MDNTIEQKDLAFRALIGSQNYNLDDQHSDFDYKCFVVPTYEDIYYSNKLNNLNNSN